jgi:hypothetical protein
MEPVTVDFWDVGLGDAAVIRLARDKVALIDVGRPKSPVPSWLDKYSQTVECLALTHNDQDHAGALLPLLRLLGKKVKRWWCLQDRPVELLKPMLREVKLGAARGLWNYPGRLEATPDESQVLLPGFAPRVRLEAIYPAMLDNLAGQAKDPNETSAICVLWVNGTARVAWPGDVPLERCCRELECRGIAPTFLVGPHHGGPQDVRKKTMDRAATAAAVKQIGHFNLWVSVRWHAGYKLPLKTYLSPSADSGVRVRCSQVTPRCGVALKSLGAGLLPTHHWLGLFRPDRGPSCMGPMRVVFTDSGYHIRYDKEHDEQAAARIPRGLCRA